MPSTARSLVGLTANNFTHPADRAVLGKAKAIPLLDRLVGKLVDLRYRDPEQPARDHPA